MHVLAVNVAEVVSSIGEYAVLILMVAFGLGLVIFVHELGHFLVAKWCGVRCDKFYVGFDVPIKLGWGKWGIRLPSALWRKQWGETEYGIGIIPLGGYVKMLGQDDNPAKAAEDMRLAREAAEQGAAGVGPGTGDDRAGTTAANNLLDPRSYMAKSVPQRMAIISAGVVMNVIFAVVFAMGAYGLGVPVMPSAVSGVVPGHPAWQADIRPGDTIVKIKHVDNPRFDELRENVFFGAGEGVPLRIRRPDGSERDVEIMPRSKGARVEIGVRPGYTTTLGTKQYIYQDSAADRSGKFQAADTIVRINDTPIRGFHDLHRALTMLADKEITVTVRRTADPSAVDVTGIAPGGGAEESFTVQPQHRRRLGIVFKMGKITGVQKNSPAEAAGIRIDDELLAVDGQTVAAIDPEKLSDFLTHAAKTKPDHKVRLTIRRTGESQPREVEVALRVPDWHEQQMMPASERMRNTAPALGIAFEVLPIIERLVPGTEAEKQTDKLRPGDEITQAIAVVPDDQPAEKYLDLRGQKEPTKFGLDDATWSYFAALLQAVPRDVQVKLTVQRGDTTHEVTLPLYEPADEFIPERGFRLNELREIRSASSFAEAGQLALKETWRAMTSVVRFLKKLGARPEVARGMSGPIGIISIAGGVARDGWPSLLLFLTLISANLAVVNFLPIPVLDGGHMVFLLAEGIRGKPVSERILIPLTWAGLLLILSLVVWTTALDTGLLPRW